MSRGNVNDKIDDEMIILNIKVSKCNKDRDNIMIIIIKIIMLLIVVIDKWEFIDVSRGVCTATPGIN